MTASAPAPARTAPLTGSAALAGTGTMVRFWLRRDRVRLPAWVVGFGVFMLYLIAALPVAYDFDAGGGPIELFQQPVGRMMIGPGYGLDDPTLARFVANGYGLYFLLLAALMSILLVIRHTRVEEQAGRAELVRANVAGSVAGLAAALIVAIITNVVAAAIVFLIMVGLGGFAVAGSALFAAGIAAVGLAFTGLTALTAQLTEYSRAAAGLAGIALGIAFVLRGGGDMARQGGNALSWVSPLGWGQQTAPFVLDRWWPLALPLLFAVATASAGYLLAARRDLGAGMLAVRAGRPRAATSLGTPLGLALRLQRANIIGWTAALAAFGTAFGAYTDVMSSALDSMPDVFLELFGGAESFVDGYLAYMAVYMAYVVSIYAILAVVGLRSEETTGRGEPVLVTPVSRWSWMGANLAVTTGGIILMMLVTGVATGIAAAVVTGDGALVVALTLAHLNHVPAVLVVLGLATLLFGVVPRAIRVAWALPAYGLLVGTFGPMLDLPQVAYDLSPYEQAAQPPVEAYAFAPLALLALAAAAAAALGMWSFRRRDLDLG